MSINQKLVKEKLAEWAILRKKLDKAAAQRNKELDPFIREHNEKIAPIIEKYDKKYNPLVDKSNALAKEISDLLMANTDKDGQPKQILIEIAEASAQLTQKDGARTVDVQKFFNFVKNKTSAFWDCLTVQVGKADKLIGKTEVDKLSEKKTTFSVSIQINK